LPEFVAPPARHTVTPANDHELLWQTRRLDPNCISGG
jgi:hypothetical protein